LHRSARVVYECVDPTAARPLAPRSIACRHAIVVPPALLPLARPHGDDLARIAGDLDRGATAGDVPVSFGDSHRCDDQLAAATGAGGGAGEWLCLSGCRLVGPAARSTAGLALRGDHRRDGVAGVAGEPI